MKREFITNLVPSISKEVLDSIMNEHGKDIETHKQQLADLTTDRDGLQTQLDGVAKKLGAFEGVDLNALKQEIETLKGDISKKDADYQSQLSERDFQAALSTEITAAKGKNAKAIMALLNIDTLKTSKNQKEDVAAALKALQESDTYLFDENKKNDPTPAKFSTGGAHDENGDGSSSSTNAQMNALITGKLRGD